MKILIVAMSSSIHTAGWLSQVTDQGWDIHLFPSIDLGLSNTKLKNVTVHHTFYGRQPGLPSSVKFTGVPVFSSYLALALRFCLRKLFPSFRAKQLAGLIRKLKPDLIHTMETQQAGYLMLEVLKENKLHLPPWVHTIWGSDLFLFGRLPEHKLKIQQVLQRCDFYLSECDRDISLAKKYGFTGTALPCFPVNGGFDLDMIRPLSEKIIPSKRRYIIIKGYQNWAGRALVALRALRRCADIVKEYTILLYAYQKNSSAETSEVEISARLLAADTGCRVEFVPTGVPYEKLLECFAKSRIYIGLSISDGISVSMLEAMTTGAFPIQSNTACANEWLTDGISGIIVPPEEPEEIEQAIRKALGDDALVDNAAKINWEIARLRLDRKLIKQKTIGFYQTVISYESRSEKTK